MGIDLSPAYIDRARSQYPAYRFEVMDALSMQFADDSFDTVIISGVIHHLQDAQSHRLLEEVHRVLRPHGRLLLWEDIPTRSAWNVVGSIVHRLDMGDFIRDQGAYEAMLSGMFEVEREESFRSGFMDYVALAARKLSRTYAEAIPTEVNAADPKHALAAHLPVSTSTSIGWMHAGNTVE